MTLSLMRAHARARRVLPRPTINDCREYCAEKGYQINPDTFFYFYEAKDWKIGKDPMVNWHMAMAGWNAREVSRNGARGVAQAPKPWREREFEAREAEIEQRRREAAKADAEAVRRAEQCL